MPIEMPLSARLLAVLRESGSRQQTFDAFHAVLTAAVRGGESTDAILAIMQELRSSVSEKQEEILLDGMDCLVGWCHPDAKIA